jgi:hypothetical protein
VESSSHPFHSTTSDRLAAGGGRVSSTITQRYKRAHKDKQNTNPQKQQIGIFLFAPMGESFQENKSTIRTP